MADIFLSYASEDRERIVPLARLLEGCGWSVFWDRKTPIGILGLMLRSAQRNCTGTPPSASTLSDSIVHSPAPIFLAGHGSCAS